MYSFDYARPATVAEAAAALAKSPDARCLAGGHTLLPTIRQRLANPSILVDLGGVAELKGIRQQGSTVVIGALATHAEVASNVAVRSVIPALGYLASEIGDPQVRNRGTIGGSLANNDPAADYPAAVLALGAVTVTSRRQIPADQFFQGLFSTALEQPEIITRVEFPVPSKGGYAKFEQRASRYALVGVFVAQTESGVRVAVTGSGASGVFRVPEMERALAGNFSPDALKSITIDPRGLISDLHGSAEYRAAMIPVIAERAVAAANAK
jgi:aerobic carbon-monoxide dehydrogenase medium subunit